MIFSRHRLRGLRDGHGLSQQALAARVPSAVDSIRKWESGIASPSVDNLDRLAAALGVTSTALAAISDDPVHEYVAGVLHDAPPLPADAIEAAATVLRRIPRARGPRADAGSF